MSETPGPSYEVKFSGRAKPLPDEKPKLETPASANTVFNRPERGGARVWSPKEMEAIQDATAKADAAARRERQNEPTQVVRERTPKPEPEKKRWLSRFFGG